MEYTVFLFVVIVSLTTLHATHTAPPNYKTVVFKTPVLRSYIVEATKNLTRDVLKKYLFDNSEAMGRFGGKLERVAEKLLEKEIARIEEKMNGEGQPDYVFTTAIEPNFTSQDAEDQYSDAYQVDTKNHGKFDSPTLCKLIKSIVVDESSESSTHDSVLDTEAESTLAPSSSPEDTDEVESTTWKSHEETPVSQLKGLLKVLKSHNVKSTAFGSWQPAQSSIVTEETKPDTLKSTTRQEYRYYGSEEPPSSTETAYSSSQPAQSSIVTEGTKSDTSKSTTKQEYEYYGTEEPQSSTETASSSSQPAQSSIVTEETKSDTSKSTTRQEYEYYGSEEPHSSTSTERTKPDTSKSTTRQEYKYYGSEGPTLGPSASGPTYISRRVADVPLRLHPQERPDELDTSVLTKSTEKKLQIELLQQTLKKIGLELGKAIQALQEHPSSAE